MRRVVVVAVLVLLCGVVISAQTRRAPVRRAPAPAPPPAPKTEPVMFDCPSLLGEGIKTKRTFCDVLTGRDPTEGIMIMVPPHTGPAMLMFDLHNRHTYSEAETKANRGYRKYTATIGVLTMNNDLLSRAIVQNEFRTAGDLIDRIGGGAGPGGVKAVAPTGTESVAIAIPEDVDSISILGEKLSIVRLESATPDLFTAPGRPIAIISNVTLEYTPPPPPRRGGTRAPAPPKPPSGAGGRRR